MGPFAVLEFIGLVTYRIALPQVMKEINIVFHVSTLKRLYRREKDKGSLSVIIGTEGNAEKDFIAILNKNIYNRRVVHLV